MLKGYLERKEREKRGFLIEFSVKQTLFTKEFIITEKALKKVESIFGYEKSSRNCHSSVANKRQIEM